MRKHFARATELYKKGDYVNVIKEWQKVLEIDPSHKLSEEKILKARAKLKNGN